MADVVSSVLIALLLYLSSLCELTLQEDESLLCVKLPLRSVRKVFLKPRRYDIDHMGRTSYFHGWADVQGQGAANDFCRVVGSSDSLLFVCSLAGTSGQSDHNYKSVVGFNPGVKHTWYMKDEDGDGRDDYCRCVSNTNNTTGQIWCTKAGSFGFYGSREQGGKELTFPVGEINSDCHKKKVNPVFGKPM